MECAVILCTGPVIDLQHLPDDMQPRIAPASDARANPQNPLCAAQARAIQEVLAQHDGSRRRTAEALGISAVTLWRKMKAFGL
jgi:transcriptional regulator with PAS, ATPase and Fis domain